MGGRGSFRGRGGGGRGGRGGQGGQRPMLGKDEEKQKLGHLPEEMMAYYRQVSATIEAGFDDDDPSAKRDFLNNVYAALKDEGLQASQNQTVSRLLETLFSHSEPAHLRTFFCDFCKHLTTVCTDRFASHVLQSLIQYLPAMYDDNSLEEEDKELLKASIKELCQHTLTEVKQFMTDTYGSHVLRSLLETLGGVQVKEEVVRSHISRNQRKDSATSPKFCSSVELSRDYHSQYKCIKDKVVTLCNYSNHLTDSNYSPVLQTVLLILHKTNTVEYNTLSHAVMEKAQPPTQAADKEDVAANLSPIVQDSVGSYLIELIVSLSSDAEMIVLYEQLFKGKMVYFAVHPVANFILQRLVSRIADTNLLKEVLAEISQFMEDILAVNHIGVIVKLAEACKRLKSQQDAFPKALMKAFHCNEPEDRRAKLAPLIAAIQTYESFYTTPKTEEEGKDEETKNKPAPSLLRSINFHGSLILQHMLQFDRPKHLVNSLLALTPAELSLLASDVSGSHVVEALFASSGVWDRSKDEFLKKVKGFYTQIACSKNGSRCLEGIWKDCALKNKILIAEELVKGGDRIRSDKFGHFLHNNFALLKFSSRRKEWTDIQSGIKKKQQMLHAILHGDSSNKKKKRKRKAPEASETSDEPTEKKEPSQPKSKMEKKVPSQPKSKMEKKENKSDNNSSKIDNNNTVSSTGGDDNTEKKKGKKKLNKKKRIKLKKEMRLLRSKGGAV